MDVLHVQVVGGDCKEGEERRGGVRFMQGKHVVSAWCLQGVEAPHPKHRVVRDFGTRSS